VAKEVISEVGKCRGDRNGEVGKSRGDRNGETVKGRRSYVEALGMPSIPGEECFNSYIEPIARIPAWLKEASAGLGPQAHGCALATKGITAPAKISGVQDMLKIQSVLRPVRGGVEMGGGDDILGGVAGEMPASRLQFPGECCGGKRATVIGHGLLTGLEGGISQEQPAINVKQELYFCRESLRILKGEVDFGLERLDRVIKNLEDIGLCMGWILASPKTEEKWIETEGNGLSLGIRLVLSPIIRRARARVCWWAQELGLSPAFLRGLRKGRNGNFWAVQIRCRLGLKEGGRCRWIQSFLRVPVKWVSLSWRRKRQKSGLVTYLEIEVIPWGASFIRLRQLGLWK
jgi:hypothetical protein